MKKWLPYIIGFALLGIIAMVIVSGAKGGERKFDERITFRQQDKIPYGSSVAKRLLPEVFPNASVYYDRNHPGYWDSIRFTSYNQAVILVAKDFEAARYELERLMDFVENGNYVFIIARTFSGDTRRMFEFSYATNMMDQFISNDDSLWLQLNKDYFSTNEDYVYPGLKYDSWFSSIDTAYTTVLGTDRYDQPNFLRIDKGQGAVFFHSAPMAFSNYFILHKNNYRYYEKALSVIPKDVNSVLWNDYYLDREADSQPPKKNWLSVLFRYESFKWGLLTAIITLLLYVLLASRRRQKMIPVYQKPKNDSLDFVKTMGRLYHDRRDHKDLARKMSIYFLEHVRSVYKLSTHTLDAQFINSLHFKSGYSFESLQEIVFFIAQLDMGESLNENELARFHRQLELFYQNT